MIISINALQVFDESQRISKINSFSKQGLELSLLHNKHGEI